MVDIKRARVAAGNKWSLLRETNNTIEGLVHYPLQNGTEYLHNIIWEKSTGLPIDVTKYTTRYYLRLV